MKRTALVGLLAVSGSAYGEAFKGQDLGGFVGGVFMALLGMPVAVGLAVYGLLRLSNRDYTAPWGISVFFSCVAWWGTWFLLAQGDGTAGGAAFLLWCASAGAAAGGYYTSRELKPE
jgi:hypothetical protein